jgi:hypothetical protein
VSHYLLEKPRLERDGKLGWLREWRSTGISVGTRSLAAIDWHNDCVTAVRNDGKEWGAFELERGWQSEGPRWRTNAGERGGVLRKQLARWKTGANRHRGTLDLVEMRRCEMRQHVG